MGPFKGPMGTLITGVILISFFNLRPTAQVTTSLVLRNRVVSRIPQYIEGAQRVYNATAAVARGINRTAERYREIRQAAQRASRAVVRQRRANQAQRRLTYEPAQSSRPSEDFTTPRHQSSRPRSHNSLNSGNMTPRTPARSRSTRRSVGKRYKTKRGRSKKRVKGRKKRRTGGKKALGAGASLSHIVKMITTPMIIKQTGAFSKNGFQGLRSHYMFCLGSRTDLVSLNAMRPHSPFVQPGTTTEYGTSEYIHIDKNQWNMIIQNRSNWDMKLHVYQCLVRNDMSTTQFPNAASAATTIFRLEKTGSAVPKGAESAQQPTYTEDFLNADQAPTFTPFMSPLFCQMFKILKSECIQLGPNDYVNRTYKISNRKFPARLYAQTDTSAYQPQEWMHGWTKFVLFSWVGGPVDTGTLSTNASTDHTQTKSKPDLYVQYDHHVNFHFSPKSHHLYRIGAGNPVKSNTTNADEPIGVFKENNYTTDDTMVAVAPATATIQVPASAADTTPIIDT